MTWIRRVFGAVVASLAVVATAMGADARLAYPATARGDQVDEYHGAKVADPYRWLEQDVRQSAEVAAWVAAENRVTFAYLEAIPQRAAIRQRLGELWNFERYSAPSKRGGRYYFLKNDGLQNQDVLWVMDSLEGEARVLLDPNTWSKDGTVALSGVAPSDDGHSPADLPALAARAQGRALWGVLRGDADNFRIRLRRAQTIEEHVRLSVLYKQFFAGELEVLCSQPEFWRKVSILYSGGDDFAVYGAWDALIPLAREMQRLFHRFTEENLKDFPGPEGKTISMALALAPELEASLAWVHQEAGYRLEQAKDIDKDCISVLGRVLEWRHLGDAAELKDTLAHMVGEFGSSGQFLSELSTFYRKGGQVWSHGAEQRVDRPWRFQRRLNRVLAGAKDRELQKLRQHLASEMMGRGAAQVKLRPAGLVALEWARLLTEV